MQLDETLTQGKHQFSIKEYTSDGCYMYLQILTLVCDNSSNNNMMIIELSKLLCNLPGAADQSQCFTHVLNFVIKSKIQQFDIFKSQENGAMDEAAKELAATLKIKELLSQASSTKGSEVDDNVDGWIDECDNMTKDTT